VHFEVTGVGWQRAVATGLVTAIAMACTGAAAPSQSALPADTPAARRIAAAERATAANPRNPEAFNALALAFARRARETADPQYYARAERAIERSLQLSPDNFEALKVRAWVLLGQHQFADALDLARALNKRAPDDLLVYGFLTDAYAELGRYREAEEACQWMLDLRPGNIPAFTRAAYLRELFGDIEGAIELMAAAYERSAPGETEDRAWMLAQLGHLAVIGGKLDDADRLLADSLKLFPDYHYALAALAKLRTVQGRHADAVVLLRRRYEIAPHPENLYDLARALARAGRQAEATRAFATFEAQALKESAGWDNANRELVYYYIDVAHRPEEALRIAEREAARRQDVHTLAAHASALHASGRTAEAKQTIDRALAVGVKDPDILARAEAIVASAKPRSGSRHPAPSAPRPAPSGYFTRNS
jgi:tetratricopeptide (TPR) repeat protein